MTSTAAPTPTPLTTTRRYSWPRALALNFAPGLATVGLSLAAAPLARSAGLPAALGYSVAIALVTLGEITYLRGAARRETGIASLLGAVSLRHRMGWGRAALWTAGFIALTVALDAVLAPVSGAIDGALGWLPTDLSPDLDDSDVATFGTTAVLVVMVLNWLLDTLVNAPIEELYWKGHLMPRLPVTGLTAPALTGLLFASEHFWEPADFALVALVQIGLSTLTWRTRSLGPTIATHVAINTLATTITAISLLT